MIDLFAWLRGFEGLTVTPQLHREHLNDQKDFDRTRRDERGA
jgi:hypothetical protein